MKNLLLPLVSIFFFFVSPAFPGQKITGLLEVTGNTGLGTTTPPDRLYVVGTATVQGLKIPGNSVADNYVWTSTGTDGAGQWEASSAPAGSSQWLTVPSVGIGTYDAVGIGTVDPTGAKFTVVGGNVGIGTTIAQGALTVMNGNVGIGTWKPGTRFEVQSTTETSGDAIIRLSTESGNIVTGNTIGTVEFYANDLSVDGTGATGSVASIAEQDFTGVTRHSGLAVSTATANAVSEKVRISGSGNVGVGTTIPGGRLSVMGGNAGIGTWNPGALFQVGSGATPMFSVPSSGTSAFSGSVNFGQNGTSPLLAGVNGNAAGLMTVRGASNTTGGLVLQSTSSNGTTDYIRFALGNNGATEGMRLQDNSGVINVGIGTTIPGGGLTVMNGNVGIGTWKPAYPLEVKTAETFGINTNANIYASGTVYGTQFIDSTNSAYYIDADGGGGSYSALLARNVGIGTTIPQGGLSVMNGNVGIGTWIPGSLLHLAGAGGSIGIGTTLTTTSALTVMSGNVGIGTWVPSGPLTVRTGTAMAQKIDGANTACNTTCGTFSCIEGFDTAVTSVYVACTDASADTCNCSK